MKTENMDISNGFHIRLRQKTSKELANEKSILILFSQCQHQGLSEHAVVENHCET